MQTDPGLYAGVHTCRRCVLSERRGEPVMDDGDGSPGGGRTEFAVPAWIGPSYREGGLAAMAQSPGEREGARGVPLVGPAGHTFDQLLDLADIDRDELLLLNRIRCHPPQNRFQDYPDAVFSCDAWSTQELRHYNPAVVVLMGNDALRAVFGEKVYVTYTRGTFRATSNDHPWGARCYLATFHPSAVRRSGGANSDIGRLVAGDLTAARELWYGLDGGRVAT